MKHNLLIATLAGIVVASSPLAHADPTPHNFCVGSARGVPTRDGAPAWASWVDGPDVVEPALDDPRWNQAATKSFITGSAGATLQVRSLWATDKVGQNYLYLSLVSNLDPNATTPRDVFLGFRRAHTSPTIDGGAFGYIFQFHLSGTAAGPVTPKFCSGYDKAECMDSTDSTSFHDWWRMFSDPNLAVDPNKKCTNGAGSDIVGHQYVQMQGTNFTTPPFTWKKSPTDSDFVQYWRSAPNQWAIQLRIKLAPTTGGTHAIADGIEPDATFWYEVTESVTQQYMSIARYPEPSTTKTGVSTSICVSPQHGNDSLFHQELGSIDSMCPACNPNHFSKLTEIAAAPGGGDCDSGLAIYPRDIGAVFNNPGFDVDNGPLTYNLEVDASKHANTIIARVENNVGVAGTGPDIAAPVTARFRLGDWGSGPIGSSAGEFNDIPGGSAVCLGGASCASQTIPYGTQKAIHFDWTLGNDPAKGMSELCAYGQAPSGGSCIIGNGSNGCPVGQTKSSINPDPTTGVAPTCMTQHNPHECIYVELTSANAATTFLQASAFNNMNFGTMSTLAREALIDGRKLPTVPGQQNQDIYFFVIPRNMPATVPAGTTVTGLIQSAAITRAFAASQPYLADINRLSQTNPALLKQIEDTLARQRPGQQQIPGSKGVTATIVVRGDQRPVQIRRAQLVMPNDDWARIGNMLSLAAPDDKQTNETLVHSTVGTLGPEEAAQLVPTLDVYPFYKAPNEAAYQPMTSFTLFLSHESTLAGMSYQIDGATQIAENVYHLSIPVGYARTIQVRAQALGGTDPPLGLGNPKWPCTAVGCAGCGGGRCGLVSQLGNTIPALIAGVLVLRRRRKKRPTA